MVHRNKIQEKSIHVHVDHINQPAHLSRKRLKFFVSKDDTNGSPQYFGFIGSDTIFGEIVPFYIMRNTGGSYDYYFAEGNFEEIWANRATLLYAAPSWFRGFHNKYDIQ